MLSQLFRTKSIADLQSDPETGGEHRLAKSLTLLDLTCFGIAAVIGAGIFSTIGKAAANGGPAVSVLFVATAITCMFSALCYAEFASRVPVSGSAYTYSYATFGELCAWLIGWNLLLEYAIGNSTIAFSWSDYFINLLEGYKNYLPTWAMPPKWLVTDYYSCSLAAAAESPTEKQLALLQIWNEAPRLGSLRILLDVPALTINILVSALVYIGIQESKMVSNAMVFLKLLVVMMVIAVGAFYVKPSNWSPFAPNGATGVLAGISSVFFTFIGFDAISTTAEECKNAKRDLPLATMLTLIICTVLYVILSFILTGLVSYTELNVEDPLALVFERNNLSALAGIISFSAVIAITSVFLVFQIGQPRIFMSMARDGLLPKRFAKVHPKFKTPGFATIVTCIGVGLPTLFLNADLVTDLCSMGTLFAFTFVSAGVLVLEAQPDAERASGFRVPYFNSRWVMPILFLIYSVLMHRFPANHNTFDFSYWGKVLAGESGSKWEELSHVPYAIFYLVFLVLSIGSWSYRWSLIPVLGVVSNLYLIAGLGAKNWMLFFLWCLVGFAIYFLYGFWNSKLRTVSVTAGTAILLASAIGMPSLAGEPDAGIASRTAAWREGADAGLQVLNRAVANYPSHRKCFSCHHQAVPLFAISAAPQSEHGLETIQQFTLDSFRNKLAVMREGKLVDGKTLTVGYGGWTLARANTPNNATTDAMVEWLLRSQLDDGGWEFHSPRPPAASSRTYATALALWNLEQFASGPEFKQRRSDAKKAAVSYIHSFARAQAPADLPTEDLLGALWAFRLLNTSSAEWNLGGDAEAAIDLLATTQREDGGWGQEPGMGSDAYATGSVLSFLAIDEKVCTHPAYRRGSDYLVETQQADGSWHVVSRAKPVQVYFDNGDPHGKDQFLSVMATGWASLALLHASGDAKLPSPFASPRH